MSRLLPFLAALILIQCSTEKKEDVKTYSEKYRPQYHFSPAKNWTNDPNGLVYHEGEYHLFYQYNPYGDKWGHMSWGHAVSPDLLHWEHMAVAIPEYQDRTTGDSTMIFSGTVVVDSGNTSGLGGGKGCMVAIFTSHVHKNNQGLKQHQSLAYSNDNGRTWKLYDQNPILDIGLKDFRDPKVFWYEPQQKWVMALVVPDQYKVQLYQSKNLLTWDLMSEFGNAGDTTRIWECPDLYQLPVENEEGRSKWVLSLSGSHPAGPKFVGMQYFVGEFDGTTFTSPQMEARYVDHGKDYYAGIVFNSVPDSTIMLGWVNNWTYAGDIPTSPWRGAMSIPRKLSLRKDGNDYRLLQRPIRAIQTLRGDELSFENNQSGSIEIELEWAGADGTLVELFSNENEKTMIGLRDHQLFVDRTQSGTTNFQPDFSSIDSVPVREGALRLQIFVDQSIMEVYANDGEATITSQVFPNGENRIRVPMKENVTSLKVWEMRSVWR